MNTIKKQFLVGGVVGFLLVGITFNGMSLIAAVSQKLALNQLPPEIRQGYELGILPADVFTADRWKAEISSREFYLAVQKTMQLLGSSSAGSLKDLFRAGIIARKPSRAVILRKEAFETVFRIVMHLWKEGLLNPPQEPASRRRFSDYTPAKLYCKAMNWLYEHEVIRGFEDGRLRIRRPLTNRDCLYLLVRLYEQVLANHMATDNASNNSKPEFLDLTTESWLVEPINRLASAGAFAFTNLGSHLNGDNPMKISEAAGMVSGILAQANRTEQLAKIHSIVNQYSHNSYINRAQLALFTAVLIEPFIESKVLPTDEFPYIDVKRSSSLGQALEQLIVAGLRLGYPTGRLLPEEIVSRYEIIGTFDAALKIIEQLDSKNSDTSVISGEEEKEDKLSHSMEDFVLIMKEKQQKIRTLLEKNRSKYIRK